MYLKLCLQLVKKVEGVASLTVHLVDEDDNRRVAHTADLHQLACLCLDTFRPVNYNDCRINGSERAESVFGEVLVARSVKYVHLIVLIVKLHDGGRD